MSNQHSEYRLGPLGQAIAAGGGRPMSIDPAGEGAVVVGRDGVAVAALVPASRASRERPGGGLDWSRRWWMVVFALALGAAVLNWVVPRGGSESRASREPAEVVAVPEEVAPVQSAPRPAARAPRARARARQGRPARVRPRVRRVVRPVATRRAAVPARRAPVTRAAPRGGASSGGGGSGGGGGAAQLAPVY